MLTGCACFTHGFGGIEPCRGGIPSVEPCHHPLRGWPLPTVACVTLIRTIGMFLLQQISGLVLPLAVELWHVGEIPMAAFLEGYAVGTILLLITCSIILEAK